MSEPESEAEPYSEPIPEPEAMSEPTPLSDPEPEAEMEPVTGGYSEATPQAMEFALPPAIVILVIIFGALVAYCISHRRELTARIKRFFKKAEDEPELEIDSSTIHTKLGPPGGPLMQDSEKLSFSEIKEELISDLWHCRNNFCYCE